MALIQKILNTSVVLVEEKNNQVILLAKGIGFGRKAGEEITYDPATTQVFVPTTIEKLEQMEQLMQQIPSEIVDACSKIYHFAQEYLKKQLNPSVVFLLTDHIHFAIERYRKNMNVVNRMVWEMESFYPEEYQCALECLKILKEQLKINFPENEAVNIAFHLVNSEVKEDEQYDSQKYAKVIGDIVSLVTYALQKNVNKESIHYTRFVTHIRFFVERFFTGQMLQDTDLSLYLMQKEKYPTETKIANMVKEYLYTRYHELITDEEMSFLMIHIYRLNQTKE